MDRCHVEPRNRLHQGQRRLRSLLKANWHAYQVLTKRPARAARFWERNRWRFGLPSIPAHIWIGTSVERQDVDYRVRHLRMMPAEVRFCPVNPSWDPCRSSWTQFTG